MDKKDRLCSSDNPPLPSTEPDNPTGQESPPRASQPPDPTSLSESSDETSMDSADSPSTRLPSPEIDASTPSPKLKIILLLIACTVLSLMGAYAFSQYSQESYLVLDEKEVTPKDAEMVDYANQTTDHQTNDQQHPSTATSSSEVKNVPNGWTMIELTITTEEDQSTYKFYSKINNLAEKINPAYFYRFFRFLNYSQKETEDIQSYNYILASNNPDLTTGMNYVQEDTSLTLGDQRPDLLSYLNDPRYCKQDKDCMYRSWGCTIGAYNQYEMIVPGGCGPPYLQDIEEYSDTCEAINYSSIECIDNQCKLIDAEPVCN